MSAPWDRITDDAYKAWLESVPVTPSEFNVSSIFDRIAIRSQFQQQQQQQQDGKLRCF